MTLADRLAAALSEPVHIAGIELSAEASVGVALAGVGSTADDLIAQADSAMYEAKRAIPRRPVISR
jgi:diguanylate cyclase